MEFIVDGERYSLTKQEVEARMRGVEPGHIYQYAVEVNDARYPVKQVFRVATGLEHFTTQRARDVLRRLGFFDGSAASADGSAASAPGSQPSTLAEPSPLWVLEIQTLAGGPHEFELDEEEDVQALEAEISHRIGSDGSYQGRSRRIGAVGGASVLTIAWKHVAAASLYQRQDRPAA